jgi:hydrogenase maturation protease
MRRVLVIGYGNPLRGDDGAGPAAAAELSTRGSQPALEILSPHQLTPELADPISRVDLVIFIDATAGGEPGAIVREEIEPAAPEGAFTHQVAPATLLHAAQVLYGSTPRALLYSIGGEVFDFGEGLTAPVASAVQRVCAQIREQIAG